MTVFSAVLFFVLGLVSWAASSKYYSDNLKSAMTFDGRAVAMRDWTKEKAYELSRFYVEYGVPAGYENDPQIAQQKASFDRGALNTLEESAQMARRLAHEARGRNHDRVAARFEERAEDAYRRARLVREVLLTGTSTASSEGGDSGVGAITAS